MRNIVNNVFIRMQYLYKGLLSNIDYFFNKIVNKDNIQCVWKFIIRF